MAFGRVATDEVYDTMIVPTLSKKNIIPVRVDRQEHLDDINTHIIDELKTCDLAIADLTFARPSVYFEAGFAQRSVPVIYTSRRDHLHPKSTDKFGNFKIHFDLQMKNIIAWSSESDKSFARRLDRRISYAIRPLVRAKQIKENERREIQSFQRLSLQNKILATRNVSRSLLSDTKFQIFSTDASSLYRRFHPSRVEEGYFSTDYLQSRVVEHIGAIRDGWVARKSWKGAVKAVLVHIAPSIGLRDLRELFGVLLRDPLYDINPKGPTKRLVEYLALCSFNKVPTSRLQACLPYFSYDGQREELVWVDMQKVPSKRLRQFKEIYASSQSKRLSLLGLVPSKKIGGFDTEGWRILRDSVNGIKRRQVGYLRKLPREIRIRAFDDIRSEESFEANFSKWLQSI
jgi:hypothetical protein